MSAPATTTPSTTEQKTPSDNSNKVCDYYLSSRGCVKGDECDHLHPLAPNGSTTNKVCDFFGSAKGCSKGDECAFLHVRRLNPLGQECNKICSYYLTPSGCVKGMQCDFLHPRAIPANKTREVFQKAREIGGAATSTRQQRWGQVTLRGRSVMIGDEKVCEFYLTPTGCNKGAECNYLHPRGKDAQDALSAKEAVNKGAAGASKPRGARIAGARRPKSENNNGNGENKADKPKREELSAEQKKEKPCRFFNSDKGCKKGDECEFKHEQ